MLTFFFFDMSLQARERKAKINKMNPIKLKIFWIVKETINKMKRQPIDWEKILSTDLSERGSVQAFSSARLFVTPMDCSIPGFPVHHQLPELAQTHVYRVSDAIQPSHSLSFPSPPTFNLSQSLSQLVLHIRWPKYGGFSFSISSSNEYSGLISFRID